MAALGFHIVVTLIVVCILSKCSTRFSLVKAYIAALGFHIVVTLIVVCILSKCSTRFSLVKAYIVRGLYRFVAPSNDELRALMPGKKETKPRQRRKQREEEETEGFNIPKNLPLQLKMAPVEEVELQNFAFYSSVFWLSLYTPLACFVYMISEIWKFVYPESQDTNVSVFWLIIGAAFTLQILAQLTAFYWTADDERGLLLSFGALYFLGSVMVALWADRILDINLLKAYDHFTAQAQAAISQENSGSPIEVINKNPLLLYLSLATLFSLLSTMLVFPNFRYATMYSRALIVADPLNKFLLHLSFLMPSLCLLLFLKPIKFYLVDGPRQLLTEPQLEILRVYVTIGSLLCRLLLRRAHLQSFLDLSYDKLYQLQRESGHVRNVHLQSMIYRYYSYLCAAVVQYLTPALLSFFFALLLKTTGELSWLGTRSETLVEDSADVPRLSLRLLFDKSVCKACWSLALVITTGINFSISLIGLIYNSYSGL
ncbi:unnamed protein product, partial [Mesorhabditis belari]|uniref:Transmembrane protein 161B n=1 Tax=Mesorhabditis belari TaxID=2138241 RepID=A0AAF3EJW8_9BILA